MKRKNIPNQSLPFSVKIGSAFEAIQSAEDEMKKRYPQEVIVRTSLRDEFRTLLLGEVGAWKGPRGSKSWLTHTLEPRRVPTRYGLSIKHIDELILELRDRKDKLLADAYEEGHPVTINQGIELLDEKTKLEKEAR